MFDLKQVNKIEIYINLSEYKNKKGSKNKLKLTIKENCKLKKQDISSCARLKVLFWFALYLNKEEEIHFSTSKVKREVSCCF